MTDYDRIYDTAKAMAREDRCRLTATQYAFWARLRWLGRWFWLGPLLGSFAGGFGAWLVIDILRNGTCR